MKPFLFLFGVFTAGIILLNAEAHANEVMMQSLQSQMKSMEETIESLRITMADLRRTIQSQNEVIEKQNLRINGLESKTGASAPSAVKSPVAVAGLSQGFNPDIGVVGTAQAHLTESSEDAEGKDTIALKHLEVSFAQYVDPYSRLDAVIAFNDDLHEHPVELEEGYYSHWGLPFGFTGRIGKFRAKVGKQNLNHLHQLETVDYPLVVQNFFGHEGLSSSGVRLQNQIPNPWDIPLTVTGEIFRGNNGNSFGHISRRPIFNTHLATYFELNDEIDLEMGTGFMTGDENLQGAEKGSSNFGVHIWSWDMTVNWYLPEEKKIKFQNEFYYQRRTDRIDANRNPWGFYTLLDFRFSEKFSTGIRFDLLEPRDVIDGHSPSTMISPYLTFWQSEFANFQIQYQHIEEADPSEKSDDAVYLRANFMIGSHSHPVA